MPLKIWITALPKETFIGWGFMGEYAIENIFPSGSFPIL